jgi:16S rRNA (adenine1518-N6/adenine1519-N6)-dimethyltransferase
VDASSTSATRRSPGSPPSARASARSASSGSALGRSALRALAARHRITPSKALGQHFLADPNLARAIVADAGVGPADRVLEIGAGLGSLTVALAEVGAEVLAVEFDRRLVPALREVVADWPSVRVEEVDAMHADWPSVLGAASWRMVSNLPYNVSVPLVVELLENVAAIDGYLVMVQREVGERFVASPGDEGYGPVTLRIACRAQAEIVRRVPANVFWPTPSVDSVLVRLEPRRPRGDVDPVALFRVIDTAFAERRKTMANALRRLGLDAAGAAAVLARSDIDPSARPERLSLDEFASVADAMLATGWRP